MHFEGIPISRQEQFLIAFCLLLKLIGLYAIEMKMESRCEAVILSRRPLC